MRAASRGAALTSQLLAAGGRQLNELELLDLNVIVGGLEKSLRRSLGQEISLVLMLDSARQDIFGDRSRMEQVLLNLAANARDAMPAGGTLSIQTTSEHPQPLVEEGQTGSTSGGRVRLTVKDTGRGMDAYTRTHLFEPFFTTKAPGTGTGLGLPMVYGIIRQHGGSVSVQSEPGQGTTVTMILPRAAVVEALHSRRVSTTEGATGATETILIVDDEADVRSLMRTALVKRDTRCSKPRAARRRYDCSPTTHAASTCC
ncbi:MAG TPA: ATP-binding protein [Vicinamibacterales bacterium]|nr:ATP-binding protein [Vicinamibacterales bacterium]